MNSPLIPLILTWLISLDKGLKSPLSEESSCLIDTSYKLMSSKTEYESVADYNNFKDYKLSGCDPIGIWQLSRHGARYPSRDDIIEMNKKLPVIRDSILAAENNSWLCKSDKVLLKNWESKMRSEDDYQLTKNGRLVMRNLAHRMQIRFRRLIETLKSNTQINVQTTFLNRTIDSASEYLNGFLGNTSIGMPFVTINSDKDDYLLKFPDLCERFLEEIDSNEENACKEINQFDDQSLDYKNSLEKFRSRLNLNFSSKNLTKIFELALKMCQYEYLIDRTDSIWCKFFDKEMLKTLEYREDIKYNCKYGYRYNISRLMACDLVNHVLESLQKFKKVSENDDQSQSKIELLFSHSDTILPFSAVFGIGKDPNNFNYENISIENKNRSYRISKLDPMNSNMAFVLYKCHSNLIFGNKQKYKIKAFYNEHLVQLEGCDRFTKYCDFENFIKYYKNYINRCQSTRKVCEMN